jgi:hypothetical protein
LYRSDLGFWPLLEEKNMTIKQVEDGFLRSIKRSDFVYVVNPDGYIGSTVSMEVGFCIGNNIPIYTLKEIDAKLDQSILGRKNKIVY